MVVFVPHIKLRLCGGLRGLWTPCACQHWLYVYLSHERFLLELIDGDLVLSRAHLIPQGAARLLGGEEVAHRFVFILHHSLTLADNSRFRVLLIYLPRKTILVHQPYCASWSLQSH